MNGKSCFKIGQEMTPQKSFKIISQKRNGK